MMIREEPQPSGPFSASQGGKPPQPPKQVKQKSGYNAQPQENRAIRQHQPPPPPPPNYDYAFEKLYYRLLPRFKKILHRHGVPAQDQDDVLQDMMVVFVKKREGINHEEAWMIGTLPKRCIMYWREVRKQVSETVDASIMEMLVEHEPPTQEGVELRRDLERILERIPRRYAELLRLRYFHGCTAEQIAARLGYKVSSIRKVTYRALQVFTEALMTSGLELDLEDYL